MKRWLTVVIGAMGIVALWALPPSVFNTPAPTASPEALELRSVEREVARLHAALRTLRWSDSLAVLAVETGAEGLVLSAPRGAGIDPEDVRSWEEAQREAIASLPRRDPEMVVGVLWQPLGHGTLPDVPASAGSEEVTFVGARDGTPYCLRVIPYNVGLARALLGRTSLTGPGPCRLYSAYGAPGEEVQAWLEASALGFARIDSPSWASSFARRAPLRPEGTMRLFGLSRPQPAYESIVVQACLAGRPEACERAMTEPDLIAPLWRDRAWLVANTPATSFGVQQGHPPFGYLDDGLLSEWEATFGPEPFARFWTSSAPVPEAFEAAFGVPLGDWVLGWAERHGVVYRAGPSLPWSSVWTSMLALAALAGVATAAGLRRRVG